VFKLSYFVQKSHQSLTKVSNARITLHCGAFTKPSLQWENNNALDASSQLCLVIQ